MAFVIAVAQRKGGAGKSTVAVTLATALAALGENVTLLDTDPQKTLARWHALRQGAAAANSLAFEEPSGWRVPQTVEKLRKRPGFVVIDTPPHADTDSRLGIRAADLVLLPLQPSPADLWAMEATLELTAEERKPVALLFNRQPSSGKLRDEIAAEISKRGLPLLPTPLGNRTAYASAFALGLGVVEHAPRGSAAEEARAFAHAIRREAS
ncbi:AAA family ATPase [Acetobacteraceae bacterium H6797]|nr:AAA family ATPase [Acetobacteraceae bacterium H6797]